MNAKAQPSLLFFTFVWIVASGCGGGGGGSSGSPLTPIPTARVLPAAFVAQETEVWCWAATVTEVLNYHGYPGAQCQIVGITTFANSTACCGVDPRVGSGPCVRVGSTSEMVNVISYISAGRINPIVVSSPLTFNELRNEIGNGRPVIAYYRNSFAGHVVVMYGYDTASSEIYIHDPINGQFRVPYSQTFAYAPSFGGMVWAGAIVNIGNRF